MKKYYDIATKETYTSQGVEKTKWHQVGKLMELDNGGFILNIPLLPKLYVFEQKARTEAKQKANAVSNGEEWPQDSDTPF